MGANPNFEWREPFYSTLRETPIDHVIIFAYHGYRLLAQPWRHV